MLKNKEIKKILKDKRYKNKQGEVLKLENDIFPSILTILDKSLLPDFYGLLEQDDYSMFKLSCNMLTHIQLNHKDIFNEALANALLILKTKKKLEVKQNVRTRNC